MGIFPKGYSSRLSRLLKVAANFRLSRQKSRKSQKSPKQEPSNAVPKLAEGVFKVLDSPAQRIPQSHGPSLYDIPDELIVAILDYLPQPALATMARTSRYLYSIATPLLYEEIDLQHTHRAVLLFRTLIENPDLAAFIRSFKRANLTTSCRCSQAFAKSLGSTPPDMQATALKGAKQLQTIEMRMGPAAATFPQAMDRVRYLLDDKEIKLRKMVIHPLARSFTDTIWWNKYIVAILRAQSSLEELEISSLSWGHAQGSQSDPLAQEHLPNLRRVVSASSATFKTISPLAFPSISCIGFRHMAPDEISEILPLLGSNIRSLQIVTPLALLMNYFDTPAFDQLRVLRLKVYIAEGTHPVKADPFFVYLSCLGHLEELNLGESPYSPIWTSYIRQWRRPDETNEESQYSSPEESALPIYQEICPRLLRLSLPKGFSWHRTDEDSSWVRLPKFSSILGFEKDLDLHDLGFASCFRG